MVAGSWMTTLSLRSLILTQIAEYTWEHSSMTKRVLDIMWSASMRFSRDQACWTPCNHHHLRRIGCRSSSISQSKPRQAWRNRRRSSVPCKRKVSWSREASTRTSCDWLRKIGQWSVHFQITLVADEEQQQVKTSPSLITKLALKVPLISCESQQCKLRALRSTTLLNATRVSNSHASILSLQTENCSEICSISPSRHSMLAKEESPVVSMDFMSTTLSRRAISTHNQEKVKSKGAQLSVTLWLVASTKSHRSLESSFRSTSTRYWGQSHTFWISHP